MEAGYLFNDRGIVTLAGSKFKFVVPDERLILPHYLAMPANGFIQCGKRAFDNHSCIYRTLDFDFLKM